MTAIEQSGCLPAASSLALSGQVPANALEAVRGRFEDFDRIGLGLAPRLVIGAIAAAFGSAAVPLLNLPAVALLLLLAAITAADLLIASDLGRGIMP